jgi:hypothetical protein
LLVLSPKSRVVAASAIYVVVARLGDSAVRGVVTDERELARTSTDDPVVTGTEYISYGVIVADCG